MKRIRYKFGVIALLTLAAIVFACAGVGCKTTGGAKTIAPPQQLNNKIDYQLPPIITLDTLGYSMQDIPKAVKNVQYPLFNAEAQDIYGDNLQVDTKLYKHYYSQTRSLVDIQDGCFVPTTYGIYTVVYTAIDCFGNTEQQSYDIFCEQISDITAQLLGDSFNAVTGENYLIRDVKYSNVVGNITQKVTATHKQTGKEYNVSNGSFTPEYEGDYTIRYDYFDYCRSGSIEYTVSASKCVKPIFTSDLNVREYFIVDCEHFLPETECKYYANGKIYSVSPIVSVKYKGDSQETVLKDNVFTPKREGELQIIYTATVDGKTNQKVFDAVAVDVNFLGQLDMSKYFYGETIGVKTHDYGVSLNTVCDGEIEFINDIPSVYVTTSFSVEPNKNYFNSFSFYLTDSIDESQRIKFSFIKNGNTATFYVNDEDYAYTTYSFDKLSTVEFSYDNQNRSAKMGDSEFIQVGKTLSGQDFTGFKSDKVKISYAIEDVYGNSCVYLYGLDNQTFSNEEGDGMRPYIIFNEYAGGVKMVGDIIDVEKIFIGDVLDPNFTNEYYVIDPNNKYVTSIDGILLDKDSDYTRSYSFKATEKGKYQVYIYAKDSCGNYELYSYGITVTDDVSPTVIIEKSEQQVFSLGKTVTLKKATATDNFTKNLQISTIIMCSDLTMQSVENGGTYKPTQKGVYTVYYYATDEDGNVGITSYSFIVE